MRVSSLAALRVAASPKTTNPAAVPYAARRRSSVAACTPPKWGAAPYRVKARTAHTIARRKSGRTFESTARIAARSEAFLFGISGLRGINPVYQRLAQHAQSTGWVVSDSPCPVEQLLGVGPLIVSYLLAALR